MQPTTITKEVDCTNLADFAAKAAECHTIIGMPTRADIERASKQEFVNCLLFAPTADASMIATCVQLIRYLDTMSALGGRYHNIKHYVSVTMVGSMVDVTKKAELVDECHENLLNRLNAPWKAPAGMHLGKLTIATKTEKEA
jgi:hypothetical protein